MYKTSIFLAILCAHDKHKPVKQTQVKHRPGKMQPIKAMEKLFFFFFPVLALILFV